MNEVGIHVSRELIEKFCQNFHVRKLSFFGSVLSERFTTESDIDVLVEFEDGCTPGYSFIVMQDTLSALLGRSVDLHTPNSLSK